MRHSGSVVDARTSSASFCRLCGCVAFACLQFRQLRLGRLQTFEALRRRSLPGRLLASTRPLLHPRLPANAKPPPVVSLRPDIPSIVFGPPKRRCCLPTLALRMPSWATRFRSVKSSCSSTATVCGQQLVEHLAVPGAEIGQRVIADRHAAAQPAIDQVVLAQPGQPPRRADAVDGRLQPQRHEDAGIDGRCAGMAGHRADLRQDRRQIERFDELPDIGPHSDGRAARVDRRLRRGIRPERGWHTTDAVSRTSLDSFKRCQQLSAINSSRKRQFVHKLSAKERSFAERKTTI